MNQIITARVDTETARRIGFFAKLDKLDKSSETRQLLAHALEEKELDYALERYKKGEMTIGRAAEIVGKDLRSMMRIASERGIPFQYGLKELREDFEAVKRR